MSNDVNYLPTLQKYRWRTIYEMAQRRLEHILNVIHMRLFLFLYTYSNRESMGYKELWDLLKRLYLCPTAASYHKKKAGTVSLDWILVTFPGYGQAELGLSRKKKSCKFGFIKWRNNGAVERYAYEKGYFEDEKVCTSRLDKSAAKLSALCNKESELIFDGAAWWAHMLRRQPLRARRMATVP